VNAPVTFISDPKILTNARAALSPLYSRDSGADERSGRDVLVQRTADDEEDLLYWAKIYLMVVKDSLQ